MKFFENKSFFQKITIAILVVTLFSFLFTNTVRAGVDDVLIKPIVTLLNALGDGVMDALHFFIVDQYPSMLKINIKDGETKTVLDRIFDIGKAVLLGVAIAAIAAVALPALLGAGIAATIALGGVKLAVVVGVFLAIGGSVSTMGDEVILPLFNVSPEMIFSGRMAIFDVDFFNPNEEEKDAKRTATGFELISKQTGQAAVVGFLKTQNLDISEDDLSMKYAESASGGRFLDEYENGYIIKVSNDYVVAWKSGQGWDSGTLGGDIEYDIYKKTYSELNGTEGEKKSIAYNLRNTVASWYITLRNIALVGALTILVYIGIKIILSSSASDKSKYKQRLMDWIVSMCLIFVMHYIMSGSNLVIRKISGVLNSIDDTKLNGTDIIGFDGKKKELEKVKTAIENNAEKLRDAGVYPDAETNSEMSNMLFPDWAGGSLVWPTRQMGILRMEAQRMYDENSMIYLGYSVMYLMLVTLTVIFTFTYFKRILYMAFLTLIAPLVAMTYSLDKLKDGKAQGFNMWFREYIVNLIIQPIHLLLYTVLINSAINIATGNPIFGIVAIGFITPAEKLVRKFFGVPTTETQGFLSGPAGTALAMTGLNRLLGHRPREKGEKKDDKDAIRFKNASLDTDEMFNPGLPIGTPVGGTSRSGATGSGATGSRATGSGATGSGATDEGNRQKIDKAKQERLERYKKNPNYKKLKEGMKLARKAINEKNQEQEGTLTSGAAASGATGSGATGSGAAASGATRSGAAASGATGSGTSSRRSIWRKDGNFFTRLGGGIRSSFGAGGRAIGRKITNPKTYKGLLRGSLGIASMMGAGTLGLAIGAASGDPMKAFQNATMAGAAGYQFGKGAGNAVNNGIDAIGNMQRGIFDASEQGTYETAEEYTAAIREREAERMAKEILNNEAWIAKYARISNKTLPDARKYLKEHRKDFLEQGLAYGFNDANEFAVAERAGDMGYSGISQFNMAKLVKQQSSALQAAGDDAERRRNLKESYKRRMKNQNGGIALSGDDDRAENLMNQLDELNTIYMKK